MIVVLIVLTLAVGLIAFEQAYEHRVQVLSQPESEKRR